MVKRSIVILMGMLLLTVSAPALADIAVEEYENLPPPMVTMHEYTPSAIVVEIPAFSPEQEQTPTEPTVTDEPKSPKEPIEVQGDYSKGTVYGPALSSRERKQLKAAVTEIVNTTISQDMTDREKIIALVNYVYDHCSYADDWSKNRANTAWGLLVYGEAQCSGYARGMVALFDAVGIENRYVHAAKDDPINPSHQWNMVKLDGQWYHLDVQMLDSSYNGANKPIVLMGSHLSYDESKYPQVAGVNLAIQ